jgi:hypothetical protein
MICFFCLRPNYLYADRTYVHPDAHARVYVYTPAARTTRRNARKRDLGGGSVDIVKTCRSCSGRGGVRKGCSAVRHEFSFLSPYPARQIFYLWPFSGSSGGDGGGAMQHSNIRHMYTRIRVPDLFFKNRYTEPSCISGDP